MTREFRLSGVRFWLWAWLLYGAFNLAVYGLIVYSGRVLDWNALLAGSAGVAVVLAAVAWKYRVTVSPEGIQFMDCQGQWRSFAWAQITWAERTSALGVPFLEFRIAGLEGQEEQEGVLLLLDDLEGFKAAVAAAAGPHHPATWALMDAAPTR